MDWQFSGNPNGMLWYIGLPCGCGPCLYLRLIVAYFPPGPNISLTMDVFHFVEHG